MMANWSAKFRAGFAGVLGLAIAAASPTAMAQVTTDELNGIESQQRAIELLEVLAGRLELTQRLGDCDRFGAARNVLSRVDLASEKATRLLGAAWIAQFNERVNRINARGCTNADLSAAGLEAADRPYMAELERWVSQLDAAERSNECGRFYQLIDHYDRVLNPERSIRGYLPGQWLGPIRARIQEIRGRGCDSAAPDQLPEDVAADLPMLGPLGPEGAGGSPGLMPVYDDDQARLLAQPGFRERFEAWLTRLERAAELEDCEDFAIQRDNNSPAGRRPWYVQLDQTPSSPAWVAAAERRFEAIIAAGCRRSDQDYQGARPLPPLDTSALSRPYTPVVRELPNQPLLPPVRPRELDWNPDLYQRYSERVASLRELRNAGRCEGRDGYLAGLQNLGVDLESSLEVERRRGTDPWRIGRPVIEYFQSWRSAALLLGCAQAAPMPALQPDPVPVADDGNVGEGRFPRTGVFITNFGEMTLRQADGSYTDRDGQVVVERVQGDTIEGTWRQSTANQQCADQSYRGRFVLTFNERGFAGRVGYCDGTPDRAWNGVRVGDGQVFFRTGEFDTDFGKMNLGETGGVYVERGGQVTITRVDGNTVEGIWLQSTANQRCPDGSYRGRFRFTFTARGFTGQAGYCNEDPNRQWNGVRVLEAMNVVPPPLAPSPAVVAASPAPVASPPPMAPAPSPPRPARMIAPYERPDFDRLSEVDLIKPEWDRVQYESLRRDVEEMAKMREDGRCDDYNRARRNFEATLQRVQQFATTQREIDSDERAYRARYDVKTYFQNWTHTLRNAGCIPATPAAANPPAPSPAALARLSMPDMEEGWDRYNFEAYLRKAEELDALRTSQDCSNYWYRLTNFEKEIEISLQFNLTQPPRDLGPIYRFRSWASGARRRGCGETARAP